MTPPPAATTTTADGLASGDRLLRLGDITYAQAHDPHAPPVLVCGAGPAGAPRDPDTWRVITSAGVLYTHRRAPATVVHESTVDDATVLLVSRRRSLHAALLALGAPLVRRAPLTPDPGVPAVTPAEWHTAALVVVDGHLAQRTLLGLWGRGDLGERTGIVMVGTDPDDTRIQARSRLARARLLAVLPSDRALLAALFAAAGQRAA